MAIVLSTRAPSDFAIASYCPLMSALAETSTTRLRRGSPTGSRRSSAAASANRSLLASSAASSPLSPPAGCATLPLCRAHPWCGLSSLLSAPALFFFAVSPVRALGMSVCLDLSS